MYQAHFDNDRSDFQFFIWMITGKKSRLNIPTKVVNNPRFFWFLIGSFESHRSGLVCHWLKRLLIMIEKNDVPNNIRQRLKTIGM